jgi:hypothetical protein
LYYYHTNNQHVSQQRRKRQFDAGSVFVAAQSASGDHPVFRLASPLGAERRRLGFGPLLDRASNDGQMSAWL